MTSSWAVHWDARLVKPSMSAKRMLGKKERKKKRKCHKICCWYLCKFWGKSPGMGRHVGVSYSSKEISAPNTTLCYSLHHTQSSEGHSLIPSRETRKHEKTPQAFHPPYSCPMSRKFTVRWELVVAWECYWPSLTTRLSYTMTRLAQL